MSKRIVGMLDEVIAKLVNVMSEMGKLLQELINQPQPAADDEHELAKIMLGNALASAGNGYVYLVLARRDLASDKPEALLALGKAVKYVRISIETLTTLIDKAPNISLIGHLDEIRRKLIDTDKMLYEEVRKIGSENR